MGDKYLSLKNSILDLSLGWKHLEKTAWTNNLMEANINALNDIYDRAKKLERESQLLKAKYDYDTMYARIYERLKDLLSFVQHRPSKGGIDTNI